ncbi:MAG: hemolysin III family protein [Oscillospiraceae bacterium]|nr:hemolysin III family protein [Oscillospiraceae bacterium]
MKRTKLCHRKLPDYTPGEELTNTVTHILGGVLGAVVLVLCLLKADSTAELVTAAIYGSSMIALYSVSSVYHGLPCCTGKKVMQIIDHCTIYFLIAGTYTPIVVCAIAPVYPTIGWGLCATEWAMAIVATTLTAIDLKKYNIFSMICYIGMGWGIIFFLPKAMKVLSAPGFYLLLSGGIAYTVGAVLYGIGVRKRWMHSVFHGFVVLGSLLQFLAVYLYVL